MIIGPKFNSNVFFYDKASKEFTQEISSMGNGTIPIVGRLYDDACDEGFVMVSSRTGKEMPFYLADVETKEGDILCWNFKAVSQDPAHKYLTATIFND